MSETAISKCHKREHVLMGVTVEAELPIWPRPHSVSVEAQAQATEEAVAEFKAFLRDHRSQDRIQLVVLRRHMDLCSACGEPWEVDNTDGDGNQVPPYCANCGAEVQEMEP